MSRREVLPLALAVVAGLTLAACSDGGQAEVVGTWRAVADTAASEPSVLYEFRPDHTLVLQMRRQGARTEGTWIRGQGDEIRIEFGEGSFFPGRTLDGRVLSPDSLRLEIRGTERLFVPYDTAGAAGGS